jgi:hypothetical protein
MRSALDLRETRRRGDLLRDEGDWHEVQGQEGCSSLQGSFGRHGLRRQRHELLRRVWPGRLHDDDRSGEPVRRTVLVSPRRGVRGRARRLRLRSRPRVWAGGGKLRRQLPHGNGRAVPPGHVQRSLYLWLHRRRLAMYARGDRLLSTQLQLQRGRSLPVDRRASSRPCPDAHVARGVSNRELRAELLPVDAREPIDPPRPEQRRAPYGGSFTVLPAPSSC